MRRAGAVVAEVLEVLKGNVRPGATTLDLEKIAEEETIKRKASPAFKGYRGYPFCLCTSVNNEVVHGMPSKKVLKEGDIVSIDYGALVEGFYGDAAVTVPVGKVSEEAARLVRVTEESLGKAIEAAREGNRLLDISSAVQSHVEPQGFSVVREFVGHGIGRELHEPPQVPNFGIPGRGVKLKTGMVLAIEPMINSGGWAVKILADGWTAVTADGKLSAHFEHTVAITPDGPRVLTMI
ncbi:MAG: type I methionyl aminopeptidase [Deltaproteobacteria bacterium GWA2_54_12]|nr:MAG: type I methionyl aminopeptidase [Deltaproteobacteria bacterium GWA2_54_12]